MRPATPWLQNHWDWRAAGNFCGGGAGTGALILAALAADSPAEARILALLGIALVGAGLSLVWAELGRPLRALNVFFHPQTSWMTREAMAAVPLALAALATALTGSRTLLALAALFAAVFLYCQARILHAAKGIPAWRVPQIVPLILATGLAEGAGLLAAAALALPLPDWIGPLLALLVLARFVAWRRYFGHLTAPGNAPVAAADVLRRLHPPLVMGGHAAPVALLLLGAVVAPLQGPAVAAAGVVTWLAGWWMKYAIVTRAAYNQGFAIARGPARTPGASRPGCKPGWS
ncbi:NrfD/PsrC family molybdoenzyme membrane anchor subunit [Inmirania thermothiophila]|uniref:Phenylacetyl-CoA:acceptor oxidoreductase PadD subunit n=1 Tax=Inmirania thermothiophila TaxID=1750597 RepID=A0A3N1Y1W1_9GAMM|nr:NrfD/PsrC family molybdoenzyme membrane anchor subunit [Inmirania thermothiophila]ROR32498.1 phenylacetyl-CoA:acceptor oxidoreductase PadD subunit [Inmirania thermothiophila]